MNQNTMFRIMELFWLSVAIILAIIGIWMIINNQLEASRIPFFGAAGATAMYILRRYQRKRSGPANPNKKP